MDAIVTGESDGIVGLSVIDNNDEEHLIEIEQDGKITGHQCDAYADHPRDRTPDENEYNEQARRYARYYVYKQRGYDTVEHTENPEFVDGVRQAIAALSDAEFEQYFGPLHQQLKSHHTDAERLVEIPAGARREDAVVYEQDVYLGLDLDDDAIADTADELTRRHGLDSASDRAVTDVSSADLNDWARVGADLLATVEDAPVDIGAVSGIHIGFPNAAGEHEVQAAGDPLERQADARIELLTPDPGPFAEFRGYLDHHLRCQVRDCFAGMGLCPPEPFRVLGFGKFIYARRYDHYDLYPPFHRADDEANPLL